MAEKHIATIGNADAGAIMELVIVKGDLAKLSPEERSIYYAQVCRSMGLNPLTKPFDYLTLSGKTVLYASKTATDQLRKINNVSIEIINRETTNGVHIVTARATDQTGRTDTEIGAVTIEGLKGDAYANALMKATTKAKRRATLSICGLGWLDESEIETIPNARIGEPEPVSAPTPIKASVSVSEAPARPTLTPQQIALKEAKGLLWKEAEAQGLTVDALNAYAMEQMGHALQDLSTSAVKDLLAKLIEASQDDDVIDIPAPGDMFPDVPFGQSAEPDQYTR